MRREYWRFYWPLALTGVAMLLAPQIHNRALASYPDAKRELAIFALALSVFGLFRATLAFVPQMANVLVRSAGSYRRVRLLVVIVCAALTAPVAFLAFTPPGEAVLRAALALDGVALDSVVRYLRFCTPLLISNGLVQFYTGLLVQAKRTGTVTLLGVLKLAGAVVVLVVGWELGWTPVTALSLSLLLPSLGHLALTYIVHLSIYADPAEGQAPWKVRPARYDRDARRPSGLASLSRASAERPERCGPNDVVTWRGALDFFWPVALTACMFALSRPIIYLFLMRLPEGEAGVAALRVSFTFAIIFHNPVNQFRHFFVTFAREDLEGVRRFMARIVVVLVAIMVLLAATPLLRLCFRYLLNIKADVLDAAVRAFWPMCLMPAVVAFRNYYHGLALLNRRTLGMGLGGIGRNVAVYTACLVLLRFGLLGSATAAWVLLLGFAAEAAVVAAFGRVGGVGRTGCKT